MTQPAKAQEPSMEEILASIRRIIADDESKAAAAETPEPVAAADHPSPFGKAASPAASQTGEPGAKAAAANSQDDIDALLAGFDSAGSDDAAEAATDDTHDDVLDLTDDMALPEMPQSSTETAERADDIEFSETVTSQDHRDETVAQRMAAVSHHANIASQRILSESTVSAVESAFNSLAHTVLSNNARTLEDLVREMLRPMLKSWLDDNLPGLVERIVKAEIERVSRGR